MSCAVAGQIGPPACAAKGSASAIAWWICPLSSSHWRMRPPTALTPAARTPPTTPLPVRSVRTW